MKFPDAKEIAEKMGEEHTEFWWDALLQDLSELGYLVVREKDLIIGLKEK